MKRLVLAVMAVGMLVAGAAQSAEELHNPGGIGGGRIITRCQRT